MTLTAEQILNATSAGEIFTGTLHDMKSEYTSLARKWHPDVCHNSYESNAVMAKINALYKQGAEMLLVGTWEKTGFLKLTDIHGKVHEIHYRVSHPFELGIMYIADTVVVYLVDEEHRILYDNAIKTIQGFSYANDHMKAEISKCLPKILSTFETPSHKLGMVIEKTSDLLLLKDVLQYYDGRLSDVHTAWILSTLYNIVCYMDFLGVAHHGMLLDTYFISPKNHTGSLLGGWWYAAPQGSKIIGVPEATYSVMSPDILDKRYSSIMTDLESIRLIGRQLLGDRNGTKLSTTHATPHPMIDWVRGVVSQSALDEYTRWGSILEKSFGRRRFVEMDLNVTQLYKKIKEIKN